MFKKIAALTSLTFAAACMAPMEDVSVTRDFTGTIGPCPGLTGVSAIYSQTAPGLPVRCGPQSEAPVTHR